MDTARRRWAERMAVMLRAEPGSGCSAVIGSGTLSFYLPAHANPLISFQNVSVSRGERLGLRNFTLEINAGEHLAILGPNGSGKSTLIKTITRECYPLVRPETRLEILGRDSWDIFELRAHMGLVSND